MKPAAFISALLLAISTGAYENTTLNITACGGKLEGTRYTSIGSLVPVGATTLSTSFANHSGFAAGFILQPETAFSGLADEWNPDNELDGLPDAEEIAADSSLYLVDTDSDGLTDFDEVRSYGTHPGRSDTDADGMRDDRELIAGTSPLSAGSLLAVECVVQPDGGRLVSWFGVAGRLYTFEYANSLNAPEWSSYPFEVPGYDSPIAFIDIATAPERFYRVLVRKP